MAETKPKVSKETQRALAVLKLDLPQIARTDSIFNANQIQKIFNSTPKKWVYSRPAKGGGNWTYVRGSYVRRTLDGLFGFNWDFDIETSVGEAFEVAKLTGGVVVKGTLTGRTKTNNEWHEVRKTQFGRAEVKWRKGKAPGEAETPIPLDIGNDFKAAATDAFKKCASTLGIAADIYDPEEFIPIEVIGADQTSDKAKATEEKIKQMKRAKKVIKQQPKEVKDGKA